MYQQGFPVTNTEFSDEVVHLIGDFHINVSLNNVLIHTSSVSAGILIEYALFVTTNVSLYLDKVVNMVGGQGSLVTIAEYPDNLSTVAECPDDLSEVVNMVGGQGSLVIIAEYPDMLGDWVSWTGIAKYSDDLSEVVDMVGDRGFTVAIAESPVTTSVNFWI